MTRCRILFLPVAKRSDGSRRQVALYEHDALFQKVILDTVAYIPTPDHLFVDYQRMIENIPLPWIRKRLSWPA